MRAVPAQLPPLVGRFAGREIELKILERQRDELVASGQPLGLFNALDVPDRAGPTWSQRSGRSE